MSVKVDLKLTKLLYLSTHLSSEVIDLGTYQWAEAVRRRAQALVPVDTGFLKSTIHTEKGDALGVYHVVADAEYAAFVEYGTSNAPAQPYMTPAVRQIEGRPFFLRAIAKLLK